MNILITGGLGFIGSNFYNYFSKKYPEYNLVILDSVTYAADEKNIEDRINARILKFSITDRKRLFKLFEIYNFEKVIHFAAESHVDNSILNPLEFVNTNVVGTINLLDASVKHGIKLFYHISTDEVFGHLGPTGEFNEETPYDPRSPYSASKAASDHFVRAYHHTYGLPIVISNCSNNYGPNQHEEKLIPTIIKNIVNQNPIPIYGNGTNVRDWLFVTDHVDAIDNIFHKGKIGETYCIGGGYQMSNLRLVHFICDKLDEILDYGTSSRDLITFVEDRKGHDFRYAIDITKIKKILNWEPKTNFEQGIEITINYYLNKFLKRLEV
jgi:dTDP-glucose 4,6-dehydratase